MTMEEMMWVFMVRKSVMMVCDDDPIQSHLDPNDLSWLQQGFPGVSE
jgi:hypothetical protein